MPRIVIITIAITLLLASAAAAQMDPGRIGIYSDLDGTSCQVQDIAEIVSAYILHTDATDANGSTFRFAADPGVNMIYLGWSYNQNTILPFGQIETGVTFAYMGCQTEFPLYLVTIRYLGSGATTECAALRILPFPDEVSVVVVTCDITEHNVPTDSGWVNAAGDCPCMPPVATEEMTWGRIKSMYQN